MPDTISPGDYHLPQFLDWAGRQIIVNLALNEDLNESSLLSSLLISRDAAQKIVEGQTRVVEQVQSNIFVLMEKYTAYKDTVFGDILRNALDILFKELEGHNAVLRNTSRNLRLIQIFIDSIESATMTEALNEGEDWNDKTV